MFFAPVAQLEKAQLLRLRTVETPRY